MTEETKRVSYQVFFDMLEARLALSSQSLSDILLEQHVDAFETTHAPLASVAALANPLDDLHTQQSLFQAHQSTGLNGARNLYGLTGSGQTVAVIDSGIAYDHVALGKGYGANYRVVGGYDFAENDNNPYDDAPAGFHGTHVAGIIGSDAQNNLGVAPGVDLVALRVFNDGGQGNLGWVEKALQWVHQNRSAFENPITTVNMSLGTTWNSGEVPPWAQLEDELQQLYRDGIVVTVSAGNSFKTYNAPGLSYPAVSPWVIPVSSVNASGGISDFSQRSDRVLAAPGEKISSTVPDHVFGKDGKINDWAEASGTSMAAPYVAGASVLVREAMELAGWSQIDTGSIYKLLRDTSDSVYDALTNNSYARLNLGRALDSILPDDVVGNGWNDAAQITPSDDLVTNGWDNTQQDRDAYKFTATQDATIHLTASSNSIDSFRWSLWTDGAQSSGPDANAFSFKVQAGHTYAIGIEGKGEIGAYAIKWDIENTSPKLPDPIIAPVDLGVISQRFENTTADKSYFVTSGQSGIFSFGWDPNGNANGNASIDVIDPSGRVIQDTTWENGQLRVDVQATQGEKFEVRIRGSATEAGQLSLTNLVQLQNGALSVQGTNSADQMSIDLRDGIRLGINGVNYAFSADAVTSMMLNASGGEDRLSIQGSQLNERVIFNQSNVNVERGIQRIAASNFEQVQFDGGGGSDTAFLFDTAGNDQLTARKGFAELTGGGFQFQVSNVGQLYSNAVNGGVDSANLFDSIDSDRLVARRAFVTLAGSDYFLYAGGFDRVNAYSNAGGFDTAQLNDSSGNDRLVVSNDSATLSGAGYANSVQGFERVEAIASSGYDVAQIDSNSPGTRMTQGAGFVQLIDGSNSRLARGFDRFDLNVVAQTSQLGELQSPEQSSDPNSESDDSGTLSGASPDGAAADMVPSTPGIPLVRMSNDSIMVGVSTHEFSPSTWDNSRVSELRLQSLGGDVHGIETELLGEVLDLRKWAVEKLHLPEEAFVDDESREWEILDQIFAEQ